MRYVQAAGSDTSVKDTSNTQQYQQKKQKNPKKL